MINIQKHRQSNLQNKMLTTSILELAKKRGKKENSVTSIIPQFKIIRFCLYKQVRTSQMIIIWAYFHIERAETTFSSSPTEQPGNTIFRI